jgi:2,3-dihydroxybiphenyl 1,2-dioxygenase
MVLMGLYHHGGGPTSRELPAWTAAKIGVEFGLSPGPTPEFAKGFRQGRNAMLQGLGYAGFGSDRLDDWRQFGTSLVGLQAVERGPQLLAFRMDDRKQRIVIDRSMAEGTRFFGWEVADRTALDALAAKLEAAHIDVTSEPQTLADARRARALISFRDPAGNRLEAFYGAEIDDAPFRPGRSISGFRTGPLGLGHAVLTVNNIDPVMAFYVDVLGFGLSDYMQKPFCAYFFHVNARHHSLALIETGRNGMHHLMVELFSLDDVGQSYDVALSEPNRVSVTLGRHTNDFMTSFYCKTPSSFMVECGWGGREIDPATWQPVEMQDGPSLWGHERVWLPEKDRDVARDMRMRAANAGLRAPVQVMEGNYKLMAGTCAWWDGVRKQPAP